MLCYAILHCTILCHAFFVSYSLPVLANIYFFIRSINQIRWDRFEKDIQDSLSGAREPSFGKPSKVIYRRLLDTRLDQYITRIVRHIQASFFIQVVHFVVQTVLHVMIYDIILYNTTLCCIMFYGTVFLTIIVHQVEIKIFDSPYLIKSFHKNNFESFSRRI